MPYDPMGFILITSRPDGEAPADIRDEWIGCILPIDEECEEPVVAQVLSHKNVPFFGGYAVLYERAMEVLGRRSPRARQWWHAHSRSRRLIFEKDCCEIVPD